jgi:polysaccharide pyruvyl transferase WcaK-like protein
MRVTEDVAEATQRVVGVPVNIHRNDDLSPAQLLTAYGSCTLIVASRLHAVVLGIVAGTPAISLPTGVTFKEEALLTEVGLGELAPSTDEAFEQLVDDISLRGDVWRQVIRDCVATSLARLGDLSPMIVSASSDR